MSATHGIVIAVANPRAVEIERKSTELQIVNLMCGGRQITDVQSQQDKGKTLPNVSKYIENGYSFSQVGKAKELDLKKVQDGFCKALSIQWVVNCCSGASSPSDEFLSLKKKDSTYFKQLAQNQMAFERHFTPVQQPGQSAAARRGNALRESILLMSRGRLSILDSEPSSIKDGRDYAADIRQSADSSSVIPASCILSVANNTSWHMMAAIRLDSLSDSNLWYIFDPNCGLLSTSFGWKHGFEELICDLWDAYGLEEGLSFSVV
jgi:hypothetical protein